MLAGGRSARQPHGYVTETIHVHNRASAGVPPALPRGDVADLVAPRWPRRCPDGRRGGGIAGGGGCRRLHLRVVLAGPGGAARSLHGPSGGACRALGRSPSAGLEPGAGSGRARRVLPPPRPKPANRDAARPTPRRGAGPRRYRPRTGCRTRRRNRGEGEAAAIPGRSAGAPGIRRCRGGPVLYCRPHGGRRA